MKAIYRTIFRIKVESTVEETQKALANLCFDWVFDPKRRLDISKRPCEALDTHSPIDLGKSYTVETLRHDSCEKGIFWALRFKHADWNDHSISWTTELTQHPAENGSVHFCCSLLVGRSDNTYAPVVRPSSRPNIIPRVLETFGHDTGNLQLSVKPLVCGASDIPALERLLTYKNRRHPVVVMTTSNGALSTNAGTVASQLAGLAHVIVTKDDSVSYEMQKVLPATHSVYDGGLRIYWPGFRKTCNPYHHPLYTQFSLRRLENSHRKAIGEMLLDRISRVATYSLSETFLTWDKLLALIRQARLEEAKEKGEIEAMAELYAEDNDALRFDNTQLKEELEDRARELADAKEEAENWKNTYLALQQGEAEDIERPPATTVEEAVFHAQEDFASNLIFDLNAKSKVDTPYQEPSEVRDAFAWLAGPYLSARLGEGSIPDLDKDIREQIPSWFWKGGQSSSTTGKYSEWYKTSHNGTTYEVCEHIGAGSSKDPRETIRIGFCLLKDERKVLIGFIGQHQRSGKT